MWGGPDPGVPGVSSEDRKGVAPVDPWAGPGRLLLSALFFAAVLLLTFVTAELPGRTQLTVVWLSTGVQLGILLLVPDHLRIRYGVVFGVTGIAVASAGWAPVPMAVAGVLAIGVELAIVLALIGRDRAWIDGDTDRVRSWVRFACAVLVAPLAATVLGTTAVIVVYDLPVTVSSWLWLARAWYVGDAVALWLIAPVFLRLRSRIVGGPGGSRRLWELGGSLVVTVPLTIGVLAQPGYLPLSLLLAVSALLLVRHGVVGAIAGSAVVSPLVLGLTQAGSGPFVAHAVGDAATALVEAEAFLIVVTLAMLLAGALQSDRRRMSGQSDVREGVYRMIAEETADLVVVMDMNFRVVYASPSAHVGGIYEEVEKDTILDRVHPGDRPVVAAEMARLRAERGQVSYICRVRVSSGEYRWFDVRARIVESAYDSRDALTVTVTRDITVVMDRHQELESSDVELADRAGTDPLTGLSNRRALDTVSRILWEQAVAVASPLSLLVVDVDHFKAYNDRFGRQAGDQCLVQVARAIRQGLERPGDVVARFGGEEFVVLLPNTGQADAIGVAENLRERVHARSLPHPDGPAGVVTISIGVASAHPTASRTQETLFAAADAAMYRAKAAGRNRTEVESSSGDGRPPSGT